MNIYTQLYTLTKSKQYIMETSLNTYMYILITRNNNTQYSHDS